MRDMITNEMLNAYYALSMIDVERINKASKTIKDLSVVTMLTRKQRSMVKKVLFNNPATIIWWKDGTKTVVKCHPGDTYDAEKGFMAAYLKKMLGNDNQYNVEIRQWVPQEPTE